MRTKAPILAQAQALRRDYGDRCAVCALNFQLRRGEVLGLLGPNGAGKSTTLRLLCGLIVPSAGRVEIGGHDLQTAPLQAKRLLGYLPEVPPLYPELRVEEYLRHCGRLHGLSRAALPGALADTLARCGLSDSRRRLIGNLSKGYRQRVGIAQALLHDPALLVLDEPTSGLDPNQMREIRALIRELGRHKAILLSTHILPEVRAVCDRVLILDHGRQVLEGPATADPAASGLLIRLQRPPAAAALSALPGVAACEPAGADAFHLRLSTEADPAALSAALTAWGLLEFQPRREDLEDTFVRLTTGEAAAGAPPC